MRQKNPDGSLGKNLGFAFVAFSTHEHAFAALQQLNNSPTAFTDQRVRVFNVRQ